MNHDYAMVVCKRTGDRLGEFRRDRATKYFKGRVGFHQVQCPLELLGDYCATKLNNTNIDVVFLHEPIWEFCGAVIC